VAEEHTTVHVYNHFPLEATRVSLSPASRTCNHFVLKQALGLAICFALRGAAARGGVEDKETSEDGSLNHAGRRPRFTRCQPHVFLSVAAQVSKFRSINHAHSMVKPSWNEVLQCSREEFARPEIFSVRFSLNCHQQCMTRANNTDVCKYCYT
jgi:hypothetical protein